MPKEQDAPARPKKQKNNAGEQQPGCPLAKKCGGCQLQNMDYPRQLRFKQAKVVSLLGKFCHVKPIIGMENPYHYRNKVQAAFGMTRGGKIVSGVYQASSHRIVNVDTCMIEDQIADAIIVDIRNMLPQFQMPPYREDAQTGFLRHVLIKRGFASGQVMVVLVCATPVFPMKKRFVRKLLQLHPEITTIVLNVNPKRTSMLLGERQEVLFGSGFIEDTLCGCVFRISPKSFYQINPVQTEILYDKAIAAAGLDGSQTVLDAYCGIGTIGMVAARQAKRVLGVEVNREAVRDAKSNARRNGIDNIDFVCADAGAFMTELANAGQGVDVVFMDPPRAGSDRAFLSSLLKLQPRKVVYISCNPQTQQRDLRYLVQNGYRVQSIQPVDMFPHTQHVETVVLLQRKNL